MAKQRACIYSKDVQRITGKSERYARTLLTKIRKSLNKTPEQFITIEEFCTHTGIAIEIAEKYIID